ncbi:hypothetical protein HN011_011525, partial [Eciton burchellii]
VRLQRALEFDRPKTRAITRGFGFYSQSSSSFRSCSSTASNCLIEDMLISRSRRGREPGRETPSNLGFQAESIWSQRGFVNGSINGYPLNPAMSEIHRCKSKCG